MLKTLRVLALSSAVAVMGLASAHAGGEMSPQKTIVENASNSKAHTTLVAAVKAAGLVETLSGEGPFTVFAPTNAAFEKLPDGTVESLLKPESKEQLSKILTCHVVGAEVMSGALVKMIKDEGGKHAFKTVGGCEFTAMMQDGKVMIEDGQGNTATVTTADLDQSNGVIHVIDTVLLPAS